MKIFAEVMMCILVALAGVHGMNLRCQVWPPGSTQIVHVKQGASALLGPCDVAAVNITVFLDNHVHLVVYRFRQRGGFFALVAAANALLNVTISVIESNIAAVGGPAASLTLPPSLLATVTNVTVLVVNSSLSSTATSYAVVASLVATAPAANNVSGFSILVLNSTLTANATSSADTTARSRGVIAALASILSFSTATSVVSTQITLSTSSVATATAAQAASSTPYLAAMIASVAALANGAVVNLDTVVIFVSSVNASVLIRCDAASTQTTVVLATIATIVASSYANLTFQDATLLLRRTNAVNNVVVPNALGLAYSAVGVSAIVVPVAGFVSLYRVTALVDQACNVTLFVDNTFPNLAPQAPTALGVAGLAASGAVLDAVVVGLYVTQSTVSINASTNAASVAIAVGAVALPSSAASTVASDTFEVINSTVTLTSTSSTSSTGTASCAVAGVALGTASDVVVLHGVVLIGAGSTMGIRVKHAAAAVVAVVSTSIGSAAAAVNATTLTMYSGISSQTVQVDIGDHGDGRGVVSVGLGGSVAVGTTRGSVYLAAVLAMAQGGTYSIVITPGAGLGYFHAAAVITSLGVGLCSTNGSLTTLNVATLIFASTCTVSMGLVSQNVVAMGVVSIVVADMLDNTAVQCSGHTAVFSGASVTLTPGGSNNAGSRSAQGVAGLAVGACGYTNGPCVVNAGGVITLVTSSIVSVSGGGAGPMSTAVVGFALGPHYGANGGVISGWNGYLLNTPVAVVGSSGGVTFFTSAVAGFALSTSSPTGNIELANTILLVTGGTISSTAQAAAFGSSAIMACTLLRNWLLTLRANTWFMQGASATSLVTGDTFQAAAVAATAGAASMVSVAAGVVSTFTVTSSSIMANASATGTGTTDAIAVVLAGYGDWASASSDLHFKSSTATLNACATSTTSSRARCNITTAGFKCCNEVTDVTTGLVAPPSVTIKPAPPAVAVPYATGSPGVMLWTEPVYWSMAATTGPVLQVWLVALPPRLNTTKSLTKATASLSPSPTPTPSTQRSGTSSETRSATASHGNASQTVSKTPSFVTSMSRSSTVNASLSASPPTSTDERTLSFHSQTLSSTPTRGTPSVSTTVTPFARSRNALLTWATKTAQVLVTVSAVTSISASLVAPTLATQTARSSAQLRLLECSDGASGNSNDGSNDDAGGDPLAEAAITDHPTRFAVTSIGPTSRLQLQAGVVLGNMGLLVAIALLMLGAACCLAAGQCVETKGDATASPRWRSSMAGAFALLRFPSLLLLPVALLLQPIVRGLAAMLALPEATAAAYVLGVVGTVAVAALTGVAAVTARHFFLAGGMHTVECDDVRPTSFATRCWRWLTLSPAEWEAASEDEAYLVRCFELLLEPFLQHAPWFTMVDLGVSMVCGVADAMSSVLPCVVGQVINAVVFTLYLIVMLWVRPFSKRFDFGLQALLLVAQVSAAAFTLASSYNGSEAWLATSSAMIIVVSTVVVTAGGVIGFARTIINTICDVTGQRKQRQHLKASLTVALLDAEVLNVAAAQAPLESETSAPVPNVEQNLRFEHIADLLGLNHNDTGLVSVGYGDDTAAMQPARRVPPPTTTSSWSSPLTMVHPTTDPCDLENFLLDELLL